MGNRAVIAAIHEKDEKTIKKLYLENKKPFTAYFQKHYSIPKDIIGEMYQESYYIAYCKIKEGYELTGKLSALLIGIGKNLYRTEHKRIKVITPIDATTENLDNQYVDTAIEKQNIVRQQVLKLTEPCKTILINLYYHQLKYKEMIKEMENYKNINTLKSQKYKCIQSLKKRVLEGFEKAELS